MASYLRTEQGSCYKLYSQAEIRVILRKMLAEMHSDSEGLILRLNTTRLELSAVMAGKTLPTKSILKALEMEELLPYFKKKTKKKGDCHE